MEIQQHSGQGIALLTLTGEFDATSLPEVSEAVSRVVENGCKHVVLNVQGVAIVTSSAVGYLLKASKHLTSDGGALVISEPPPWFQRTIDTLGVTALLTVVPNDEAARRAIAEDAAG